MENDVQFRLKEASLVLGVSPTDPQNLVQFGVLQPRRQDRVFVFNSTTLLEAKVAFYLKESLGTSLPLLARFAKEIFREMPGLKRGPTPNISILSRPLRGKKPVQIEVPLRALTAEREAQLPTEKAPRNRGKSERNRWREEITRTGTEAAEDLKGTSRKQNLDEVKRYRKKRKKSPEITVVATLEDKSGLEAWSIPRCWLPRWSRSRPRFSPVGPECKIAARLDREGS